MQKLDEWKAMGIPFYISITGLTPRAPWKYLPFFWHAIRSRNQALRARGVLFVDVKMIEGVQHTLTAWESREHMQKFIYQGPHRLAIRAFKKLATGKTLGYVGTELPTWAEVHERWEKDGVSY